MNRGYTSSLSSSLASSLQRSLTNGAQSPTASGAVPIFLNDGTGLLSTVLTSIVTTTSALRVRLAPLLANPGPMPASGIADALSTVLAGQSADIQALTEALEVDTGLTTRPEVRAAIRRVLHALPPQLRQLFAHRTSETCVCSVCGSTVSGQNNSEQGMHHDILAECPSGNLSSDTGSVFLQALADAWAPSTPASSVHCPVCGRLTTCSSSRAEMTQAPSILSISLPGPRASDPRHTALPLPSTVRDGGRVYELCGVYCLGSRGRGIHIVGREEGKERVVMVRGQRRQYLKNRPATEYLLATGRGRSDSNGVFKLLDEPVLALYTVRDMQREREREREMDRSLGSVRPWMETPPQTINTEAVRFSPPAPEKPLEVDDDTSAKKKTRRPREPSESSDDVPVSRYAMRDTNLWDLPQSMLVPRHRMSLSPVVTVSLFLAVAVMSVFSFICAVHYVFRFRGGTLHVDDLVVANTLTVGTDALHSAGVNTLVMYGNQQSSGEFSVGTLAATDATVSGTLTAAAITSDSVTGAAVTCTDTLTTDTLAVTDSGTVTNKLTCGEIETGDLSATESDIDKMNTDEVRVSGDAYVVGSLYAATTVLDSIEFDNLTVTTLTATTSVETPTLTASKGYFEYGYFTEDIELPELTSLSCLDLAVSRSLSSTGSAMFSAATVTALDSTTLTANDGTIDTLTSTDFDVVSRITMGTGSDIFSDEGTVAVFSGMSVGGGLAVTGSLSVPTGTTSLHTLTVTSPLVLTAALSAPSAAFTGAVTSDSLTSTSVTCTSLTGDSATLGAISVTGTSALSAVTADSVTVTALTATSGSWTTASIDALTVASLTTTTAATFSHIDTATLTASTSISGVAISGGTLTGTTSVTTPALSVTGTATLSDAVITTGSVTTCSVDTLTATDSTLTTLSVTGVATLATANVTTLTATSGAIASLTSPLAVLDVLTAPALTFTTGTGTTLTCPTINTDTLTAAVAVGTLGLTATSGTVDTLTSTDITTGTLTTTSFTSGTATFTEVTATTATVTGTLTASIGVVDTLTASTAFTASTAASLPAATTAAGLTMEVPSTLAVDTFTATTATVTDLGVTGAFTAVGGTFSGDVTAGDFEASKVTCAVALPTMMVSSSVYSTTLMAETMSADSISATGVNGNTEGSITTTELFVEKTHVTTGLFANAVSVYGDVGLVFAPTSTLAEAAIAASDFESLDSSVRGGALRLNTADTVALGEIPLAVATSVGEYRASAIVGYQTASAAVSLSLPNPYSTHYAYDYGVVALTGGSLRTPQFYVCRDPLCIGVTEVTSLGISTVSSLDASLVSSVALSFGDGSLLTAQREATAAGMGLYMRGCPTQFCDAASTGTLVSSESAPGMAITPVAVTVLDGGAYIAYVDTSGVQVGYCEDYSCSGFTSGLAASLATSSASLESEWHVSVASHPAIPGPVVAVAGPNATLSGRVYVGACDDALCTSATGPTQLMAGLTGISRPVLISLPPSPYVAEGDAVMLVVVPDPGSGEVVAALLTDTPGSWAASLPSSQSSVSVSGIDSGMGAVPCPDGSCIYATGAVAVGDYVLYRIPLTVEDNGGVLQAVLGDPVVVKSGLIDGDLGTSGRSVTFRDVSTSILSSMVAV
ncbi:hypothetical protein KIPB_006375 [Kipferlia bialata]|uniref:Uncharacterized protein n=1 Tax=Kipferlia bialata TaxID=797122 RepID=A0A9K3GI54_9EUKA|nr:hypothetical protein KIPB_006375 [Kipferlia bialata]|eukprot:g6375.t1